MILLLFFYLYPFAEEVDEEQENVQLNRMKVETEHIPHHSDKQLAADLESHHRGMLLN
jgi:hypothetical protein